MSTKLRIVVQDANGTLYYGSGAIMVIEGLYGKRPTGVSLQTWLISLRPVTPSIIVHLFRERKKCSPSTSQYRKLRRRGWPQVSAGRLEVRRYDAAQVGVTWQTVLNAPSNSYSEDFPLITSEDEAEVPSP